MIREQIIEILAYWKESQKNLRSLQKIARERNETYRRKHNVNKNDPSYLLNNKETVQHKKDRIVRLITDDFPETLAQLLNLDKSEYLVKGSVGTGTISDIPWIAIYHKEITKTATKGYYPVFLFNDDCSGVYLTFLLGWTQYKNHFKNIQVARAQIIRATTLIKQELRPTDGFLTDKIDLKTRNTNLAKGYELGTICSKFYEVNSIPNEEVLRSDIIRMLSVYSEMRGLIGKDIFIQETSFNENHYQNTDELADKLPEFPIGPIPYKEAVSYKQKQQYPRSRRVNALAKSIAKYKCEYNQAHITFESGVSGNDFVEGHHLIPIEAQSQFENSLDVPENIISLCPNCHRAIHNATVTLRNEMIKHLYTIRIPLLEKRGLKVQLNDLQNLYQVG